MNKQTFDEIYPSRLTKGQQEVLQLFLQNNNDQAIARIITNKRQSEQRNRAYKLKKSADSVRQDIRKLCALFSFKNEPGEHLRQRYYLIELFAEHKPELVNPELIDESLTVSQVDVKLYVERPPIESQCDQEILESGALIRIKAPQKMGKTLLLNRIIERAEEQKYQTIILSFDEADSEILSDYKKLLQWFCLTLSDLLELDDKLGEYWDDTYGNNKSCTNYLERYLLANRSQPLLLALEKVDLVFEQAIFNIDFCRLLRSWNDTATQSGRRGTIWKQLRLIIVHSTEVYASLNIESSPLAGAGLTVPLPDFTLEQVQSLARHYQLNSLSYSELEQLMALFGGYPYLVQTALASLKSQQLSLKQLLEISPTEQSPFINDLRSLLGYLQKYPELAAAYREVLTQSQPVRLESSHTFKLDCLGLVRVEKDFCKPRCDLYRQYFLPRLNPQQ